MSQYTDQPEITLPPDNVGERGIDWDAYASQYDLMATYNPSYHQNVEVLQAFISEWHLPANARICDLGAGTGNYICALSTLMPEASFVHVDFDEKMNEIAEIKYKAAKIDDVKIVNEYIQRLSFPDRSFDLIVCVNVLYAVSPQELVLEKIARWLKPTGKLFLIDYGRRNRVVDWGWFLIKNLIKEQGLLKSAKILGNSIEIVRQNRRGSKRQLDGDYWLHTTNEFGNFLAAAGFRIEELKPCYRDYCDLAVCSLSPIAE